MGLIIRYESGLRVHALLLTTNDQKMRVAAASDGDTVELFRVGDAWETDRGETIEIEALLQIPGVDVSTFWAAMRPRTMAAGSFRD